jgi:Putative MetA-pathway of phenol degradation
MRQLSPRLGGIRQPVAHPGVVAVLALIGCASPTPTSAQSLDQVLFFLLTNRSVATDDFLRDQQAARAASEAISASLLIDLSTLPISTSAGGFTYRLDPEIGASIRTSNSFDPFYTDRALTSGAGQITFGLDYQQAVFRTIDGHALGDGTLVSTASKLRGDTQFFDVETLSVQLRTDTVTVVSNLGVTDRLDVRAALPIVRITLSGERIDTYRGRRAIQASAVGTTSGLGDAIFYAKYNVLRRNASGLAFGMEARLPTGDDQNLLGTGRATIMPRVIASIERQRATVHANLGYGFGNFSNELSYNGAVTLATSDRLTLVGELVGRRLDSLGRLTYLAGPHPTLIDVDTVRLTSTNEPTGRLVAVAGFKWNFRSTWLITAHVVRPLTDAGLNAKWTPTVTFDYSFGQ